MQHYKFIHFFWHNDLKFYSNLVKTINDPKNNLFPQDHLFVTPYKEVFDNLSDYDNVVFFETKKPSSAKMINHFAPYGKWLFVHSIPSWYQAMGIKKIFLKKIIWRTWGHDAIHRNIKGESAVRAIKNTIVNRIRLYMVHRFYAVGVSSNYIDVLDIKNNFGNVKMVPVSYPAKYSSSVSEGLCDKHETMNILVGHSGFEADNHINILEKLKRFENENICIYMIFSYGCADYMTSVIDYVNKNWPKKVVIINEFMPITEFRKFCLKMDVAIFDGLNSYAIGNVSIFFSFRKKLVFNRNGLWHKTFVEKDAPHLCSDELDTIPFAQFKKPFYFEKDYYQGLDKLSYENHVDNWKKLLESLS